MLIEFTRHLGFYFPSRKEYSSRQKNIFVLLFGCLCMWIYLFVKFDSLSACNSINKVNLAKADKIYRRRKILPSKEIKRNYRISRSVMGNELHSDIIVKEFKFLSRNYVHFQTNTLGIVMILPQIWVDSYFLYSFKRFALGLNKPQRLIWH